MRPWCIRALWGQGPHQGARDPRDSVPPHSTRLPSRSRTAALGRTFRTPSCCTQLPQLRPQRVLVPFPATRLRDSLCHPNDELLGGGGPIRQLARMPTVWQRLHRHTYRRQSAGCGPPPGRCATRSSADPQTWQQPARLTASCIALLTAGWSVPEVLPPGGLTAAGAVRASPLADGALRRDSAAPEACDAYLHATSRGGMSSSGSRPSRRSTAIASATSPSTAARALRFEMRGPRSDSVSTPAST